MPTGHLRRRLAQDRQEGIALEDVLAAAWSIPGYVPVSTRFRNFVSRSGRHFDMVIRDLPDRRLIITIIGKERPI